MIIAKISHVPIHEPIVINGMLTQAWVRFFEQLAKGIDISELVDLLSLAQLSHQLPNQAMQSDLLHSVANMQSVMSQVAVCHEKTHAMPMVAVPIMEVL